MSKTFEEIWCHKEVMGSENANALWRAGQKLAQEADAALAAKDAEIARLRDGEWHACHTQEPDGTWKHAIRKWPTVACSMCRGQAYSESLVLAKLREELAEARKVIEELADVLHSVDENTAADFLDSVESKARAFMARKETR